jgi:hypothetical protein
MSKQSIEPLKKQMHAAESEIDAIECKIEAADDSETSPADYSVMRTEQEGQRQKILKSVELMADTKKRNDEEAFLLRNQSGEELADFDAGFSAGSDGKGADDTKSVAWQRGWADAQE